MDNIFNSLIEILINSNISKKDIQVLENMSNINDLCSIYLIIEDKEEVSNFIEKNYIILYKTKISKNKELFIFSKKDFNLNLLNTLISVCIPTYYNKNRGNILFQSLEEWKNTQNINLNLVEFIIVENGSSYYKDYFNNNYDLKIRLINIKEANLGKARKLTVENANSKILILVNDDTIPTYNLVEKHLFYQILNYNRNIAILGKFTFHKNVLDDNFMKIIDDSSRLFVQNRLEDNKEYDNYKLFITNNISIRKDLIIEVGNFSEEIKKEGEDTDLGYRLLKIKNIKILFKSDLVSYHLHKHDINSYINILKSRLITGHKVIKKYSDENNYLDSENLTINNALPSKIFINYIINNYENDSFLKYYIDLIHFCAYTIGNLELLNKKYNSSLFDNINYIDNTDNIISLIHIENKKYIDILKIKNYYLYNDNSYLSDIFENKFDFVIKFDKDFIPFPYTNYLFLNVKNNIDKNIEIILGNTCSFDSYKKETNKETSENIFISKSFLIKNSYLLEYKINDINSSLFKKNIFNILLPFTSIKTETIY